MNYYVTKTGNDANPGTESRPFLTISKAISSSVNGDTIYVGPGSFSENINVAKQVAIVGSGAGTTVVDGLKRYPTTLFSGYSGIVNITTSNVAMSDMTITRSRYFGILIDGVDGIALTNVHVEDTLGSGVYIIDTDGVVVTGCDISNVNNLSSTLVKSDRDPAALEVRDCSAVDIFDSVIHDCGTQGIGIIECTDVDIDGNTIYNTLGSQVHLDGADTCTINGNLIYYTSAVQYTARGVGINVARTLYPLIYGASPNTIVPNKDIYITNNIVDGCKPNYKHSGGFATVSEEFTSQDGKTSIVKKTVAVPGYSWNNVNVVNNTFINGVDGIVIRKDNLLFEYGTSGDTQCTFANNIVHSLGSTSLYWSPNNIGTYRFINCIFSVAPPLYKNFVTITGASGLVIGTPGLVGTGDFTPASYSPLPGSAAIDTAEPTVAPTLDFAGNQRSVPDIGAVEYTGATPGKPIASFGQSATTGNAPLRVSFSDTTPQVYNITRWLWTFGDGGSSTDRNPTYVYNTPGTYTVSLSVTSSLGGTGIVTKDSLITVKQGDTGGPGPDPGAGKVSARVCTALFPAGSGTVTVAHNLPYTPEVVLIHGRAASSTTASGQAVMLSGCAVANDSDENPSVGGIGSHMLYSGTAKARTELWGSYISFYNLNTSAIEDVQIDWDETNIYISSGATAPTYSLVFNFMAIGGPDIEAVLELAEMTSSDTSYGPLPDQYISNKLGARPSVLLAWREPRVYLSGVPTDGYKHSVGFQVGDSKSSTVFGAPLSAASWGMDARLTNDRLLSTDSGTTRIYGISAELTDTGFVLWTNIIENTLLYVLSMKLNGIDMAVVDLLAQTAAGSNVVESYNLGFDPQAVMGVSSWITSTGRTTGEPAEAHGQFMVDSFVTTHMANYATNYSTTNVGSIGGASIDLSVPNETEDVNVNISLKDTGIDLTSIAGSNVSGARLPALVIGRGATGEIIPGFSVSKVSVLVGTPLKIKNLAYSQSGVTLAYYYTDGDGNTYQGAEPEITYQDAGTYTITQYVYAASDPSVEYTYQAVVNVSDNFSVPVINVDYSTPTQTGATVGSPLLISNATVLQDGQTVGIEKWQVVKINESGKETVVATSLSSPFYYTPNVEASYYISLTLYLSDGTVGTARYDFSAVNSPSSLARLTMKPVVARQPDGTKIQTAFVAPATLEFVDETNYLGTEIISRQYIFAPHTHKDRLDIYKYVPYASQPLAVFSDTVCIGSGDSVRYTFTESGLYTVAMIVQTRTNIGVVYYKDFINIYPQESEVIGPSRPDVISATSMNVIDGIGAHTHAINVTTSGEPMKIVSTDNMGNITANEFITKNGTVNGDLLLSGPSARLVADSLKIDARTVTPVSDNSELGTTSSRFGEVNSGIVSAGNLSKEGEVNSIGGSLGLGNSYILKREMGVSDSSMFIDSPSGMGVGDFVLFTSAGAAEVARVISSPRSDEDGGATWSVALARGTSIGEGFAASTWPAGSSCINLGGSGSTGTVGIESWIELHASTRMTASALGENTENGPGISGFVRTGYSVNDFSPYFLFGNLSGLYGLPDTVSAIGSAIGEYSGVSMCMIVHDDIIEFRSKDGNTSMSIADGGGLMMHINIDNAESVTLAGIQRSDEKDVFTIRHGDDIITKRSTTSLVSGSRSGWTTSLDIRGEASGGEVASIAIESAFGESPLVKITGLPTSDPLVAGALWNSAGTIKISNG